MGGYSTAMAMMKDAAGTGGRVISAGLMQGWSTFLGAGANVSVGNVKAMDDEFFYQSKFADGTASICREYLHSVDAVSTSTVSLLRLKRVQKLPLRSE